MKKEIMLRAFQSMGVADAFGYPFEFHNASVHDVKQALEPSTPIGITDDTQMALYGLAGISDASLAGVRDPRQVCNAFILPQYLAWYETQAKIATRKYSGGWLAQHPLMQASRAPGRTCMSALRDTYMGRERINNDSKGNGAVMRCLPFVFAPWMLGITEQDATKLAALSGGLTHDHPESGEAITIFMWLAFRLLRDGHLSNETVFELEKVFPKHMTSMFVMTVKEICAKENTFTAMPALKAAITAFADAHSVIDEDGREEAYRGMLVDCCANGGDSDTVAAIAGALWGLVQQPPVQLIARLTERSVIAEALTKTQVAGEMASLSAPNSEVVLH